MSRLLALFVAVALHSPMAAQNAPVRPTPADGVVRLLADLETALMSGRLESVTALAPRGMPAADVERLRGVFQRGTLTVAAARERFRQQAGGGFDVLAEVFLGYGRQGRVATWRITAQPRRDSPTRFELAGLSEVAAIEGLVSLSLDRTRQFTLKGFALAAPDLTLKMASGTAFLAETAAGVTALVLMGDGEVVFSPTDPAEQGQLRILNGRPDLSVKIESAFVRISPAEFQTRLGSTELVPARVDPARLQRAQAIFDDLSPRTFNLDLSALTSGQWSLEPSVGNLVVEFRTGRFGWLTYAVAPTEAEDISLFDRARSRNIAVYASPQRLERRGRFYSDDANAPYDVVHYALDLSFEPERLWLSGRGSIRLKARSRLAGTVSFRLAGGLTVSSVSSPDFGHLMSLRVTGQNSVIVSLPQSIERDSEMVLDVTYSGKLDSQGLDREAIAPQGTQAQDPESRDIVRLIPETRFLYSNRTAWYPQSPLADFATARMRLTVPSEYQIVASGTLVNLSLEKADTPAGRRGETLVRTADYVANRPLKYLSCVISRFVPVGRSRVPVPAVAPAVALPAVQVANPFDVPVAAPPVADDRGGPSVGIEVVSTPRMASRNRQMPARLSSIIGFYAKTIGEAPYPDFTLAGIDDNLPGGHSPAFFALLHQPLPTTPYSWSSDPVAFDAVYSHFFVAHEVAHQWWGQAVAWKNYHEQWLSEGLAQYFALLYAAHDRGPDTMRSLVSQMRSSALSLSKQGPISLGYRLGHIQNDGRVFRGLVYNKSALVLHMLRAFLGDEAFFAGLQTFYKDWRFQKAGTDDLRLAMESAARRPLQRFFERWVFSAAVPRLRATSRVAPDGPTTLRVEQLGELFDVPVTFAVQFADGTTEDVVVRASEAVAEHQIPATRPVKRASVREELTLAEFVR